MGITATSKGTKTAVANSQRSRDSDARTCVDNERQPQRGSRLWDMVGVVELHCGRLWSAPARQKIVERDRRTEANRARWPAWSGAPSTDPVFSHASFGSAADMHVYGRHESVWRADR